MSPPIDRGFTTSIDPHYMTVRLVLRDATAAQEICKRDLVSALEKLSIVCTPEDEERIGRVIRRLRCGNVPDEGLPLVKGVPPVHGVDGRVIDLVAANSLRPDEKGSVNHYEANVLRVVNSGTPLLDIVPPTPHKPGRDVFGHEVTARVGLMISVVLGPNVALSEDRRTVYATVGGQFSYKDGVAGIEPDLRVQTDVSFRTSNIEIEGEIVVDKDVFDRFQIKTEQSVVIKGAVEGATIKAGGGVTVKGGILGKDKGRIIAGCDIACQFANKAQLTAGGHISILKYCYNSELRCGAKLLMPKGVLCGGETSCQQGAVIGTLGSKAHSRTVVCIGGDERPPRVPDDGSQVTLEVHDKIFAGVELCLGGEKTTFCDELPGPVRVELHCEDGSVRMVAVNLRTNVGSMLPSDR
ncbi:MAG: DUF342 domain-containing protein [Planctomycetes bacterium]|nr:DUF342 domain-containing protein [Planctomycetota bacterium]